MQNRLNIIHGGTIASMGIRHSSHIIAITNRYQVDLGGSLAVASRGLYATGVSTDLNGELLQYFIIMVLIWVSCSHISQFWRPNR